MSDVEVSVLSTNENFKTLLKTSKHELIADEPPENGGADLGPSPHEYLLLALGACTDITIRIYAERKKMDLKNVSVKLNLTKGTDHTDIERVVILEGNLTEQERTRLLQVANACPVHKVLSNPIHIDTKLG
ncbi:OsmC family peroxiredoxin [Leptospira wolffii]|uniref:Osmotically inducible protein OsmC n=1 Tax=Leptospira wolffii TaxID=409998 RepID=A0A2M9Z7H3_9LEPT|nr:OsmC family protein [Leptospira wolffii]PJZ64272.1 osmotically inducible protein OsmC [Leptospira wolffii]TGK55932.1 OsmC family peroxiredoxin [Leptospira wolffii]TGK71978.1 OsmC family peroxiredoxin [Leptospira wolffii]TGK78632.1 OsmC family peroxiredoxin [Leptospira wolffii]TGL27555.1 OsmC family peroxiredoxin [Leptospira wolffii]